MKTLTFLTASFLVLYFKGYTQSKYESGLIFGLRGDTLPGMIDNRNWVKNPDAVRFKTSEMGEITTFRPLDVLGFTVSNEYYKSAIIEYETSMQGTNSLKFSADAQMAIDTVFLQALVVGKKTLYRYEDPNGRKSYFIDNNGKPELLYQKSYLKYDELGKIRIVSNNRYINQLKIYLGECPQLKRKTEKTPYKNNKIVSLFKEYYRCSKTDPEYVKNKDRFRIETGVIAGISRTKLTFGGIATPHLVLSDFNISYNPAGGVFFDLIFPRLNGKLSVYNEIFYSAYETSGHYEDVISDNEYLKIDSRFAFSYLKINNTLQYKYPIGKLKIFGTLGFSNGYPFSVKNEEIRESRYFSRISVDKGSSLYSIRKYEQGIILSAGIIFNKNIAEFRLESGNGMSNFPVLKSSVNRFYLLLGRRF